MTITRKTRSGVAKSLRSVLSENQGGAAIRVFSSIGTSPATVTIPEKVNKFYIENIGITTIRFNFGNDRPSDHWKLDPGEKMPFPIELGTATQLNVVSSAVNGKVRAIFMG